MIPRSVDHEVLVAGIIARYPFGGVTWCSLMYLLGLRALGHDVLYIEDTGECIYDPEQNTRSEDPSYGTRYIHHALEPFGLGDRWSFVNYDGSYHGASHEQVKAFCADAELFINLSGGSWFWRDEYVKIPRKVFIDSDPVFTQLAIAKGEGWYVDFFRGFDRLFTFGANIGTPASDVPDRRLHLAQDVAAGGDRSCGAPTRRRRRRVHDGDDVEDRELHRRGRQQGPEFIKFIDLPSRRADRSGPPCRDSSSRSTARSGCCGSTAGTRWTRWACRGRCGTTATSSSDRGRVRRRQARLRGESVRAGSATAPSAIWRRAGRRSCRTPAGAPTCRTGPG